MKTTLALLVLSFTILQGCAYWPRAGINGAFYTNTQAPVSVLDAERTEPLKVGKACSKGILGLYGSGNSSIEAARANGGITKIATVEEEFKQVFLGVYSRYCVVVSGW